MELIRTTHAIAAAEPIGTLSGPVLQVHEWTGSGYADVEFAHVSYGTHWLGHDSISIDLGVVTGLVVVMASVTWSQPMPDDIVTYPTTVYKYDQSAPSATYPTLHEANIPGLTISNGTTSVLVEADGVGANESSGTEASMSIDPATMDMANAWNVSYRGMYAFAGSGEETTVECSFQICMLVNGVYSDGGGWGGPTNSLPEASWTGTVGIFSGGT